VTNSGTLGLNWTVAPTSTNIPNAIVKRDGGGSFFAQSISATQLTANNVTASNSGGVAIVASTSGANAAITGTSTGTNAVSDGVDGVTTSAAAVGVSGVNQAISPTAIGVYGFGPGYGVYGSGFASGVFGFTDGPGYAGVAGQIFAPSSTGRQGALSGVWGDTGGVGYVGVLGTADDETAGYFLNNSPSGNPTLEAVSYDSSGGMFLAYNSSNNTFCGIDPGGNLNCSGQKHAIIPVDGGKRKVALSSIESPQNWFEDAGSTQLVNGAAEVALDPDFIQTVNTELDYHVFLTPYGDCKGLYVTNRTAKSFEVRELGGGTASLSFGYRIMALRRKYENVRFEDHTKDPDPRKMLEQMRKARSAAPLGPKTASRPIDRPPVAQLSAQ
jgi:hypothetical protein